MARRRSLRAHRTRSFGPLGPGSGPVKEVKYGRGRFLIFSMTNKYKHVIWDWNGTILDDAELCVEIVNQLKKERGLPGLSLEEYRAVFGFPVRDYYTAAGFDFSAESFETVGKAWVEEYERRKYNCPLQKGVIEALENISSLKIGQSVLSAYSRTYLEETVAHYGLAKYFTHLYGLDTIYATSKVALGKKLMEELGHKKGETLLVGDTEHDFETAAAIGADCVLIANGHQNRAKLERTGARVLAGLEELPAVLS